MNLKRLFKQARYFLVMYSGNNDKGFVNGSCTFKCTDGSYPTRTAIKDYVDVHDMVVSNIIELSRKDFEEHRL